MLAQTASRGLRAGRRRRIRGGFRGLEQQLHRVTDPGGADAGLAGGDRGADPELRPRRVLEIGVGTGLLLSQLAPECEEYWATDFSAATIEALRAGVAGQREWARRVRLRVQPADVVDGLPAGHFDTVVLNSVVQYFPNAGYLLDVLGRALGLLAPGGAVFVGDVRHLGLLREFIDGGGSGRGGSRR